MDTQTKTPGQDEQDEPTTPGVGPAIPRESAEDQAEARREASVEAYARGHEELTEENERDALDYLLAPKPARTYGVKVEYETDKGVEPLTFVIRAMDGRTIDSIEQRNVSESSGQLDAITANCELVAEACSGIESKSGRKVALDSDEFLTLQVPKQGGANGETEPKRLASPALALEARFRTQIGVIAGVAREVRRMSGYDPTRVGQAQRRLVEASGN